MALKIYSLFLFLIIFIIFPQLLLANSSQYSTFESIKHLEGSRKGDTIKGLNIIKNYLKQFGYIEGDVNPNSDYFDDVLESALKTYQSFHHLDSSGVLKNETLIQISKPHCGEPDIGPTNGVNLKYAFFNGKPRWPSNQTHLTYAFSPAIPTTFVGLIERALTSWAQHSSFFFSRSNDYNKSIFQFDITVIDEKFKTLALGSIPPKGYIRFDSKDSWYTGPNVPGAPKDLVYVYTVALHEIGHVLGLNHSTIQTAIMWPYIGYGEVKELDPDDIQGLHALYAS